MKTSSTLRRMEDRKEVNDFRPSALKKKKKKEGRKSRYLEQSLPLFFILSGISFNTVYIWERTMTSNSPRSSSSLPEDCRQETPIYPKISFVYCPQPTEFCLCFTFRLFIPEYKSNSSKLLSQTYDFLCYGLRQLFNEHFKLGRADKHS